MQFYDCKTVAELTGVSRETAQKWAAKNIGNVLGTGRRKIFIWTDADIERFKARDTKRGRKRADGE